jgi:hypothetical protein
MVVSCIEDLPGTIDHPALWERSKVAEGDMLNQKLRVIDIYQLDIVLGSSSEGELSTHAIFFLFGILSLMYVLHQRALVEQSTG